MFQGIWLMVCVLHTVQRNCGALLRTILLFCKKKCCWTRSGPLPSYYRKFYLWRVFRCTDFETQPWLCKANRATDHPSKNKCSKVWTFAIFSFCVNFGPFHRCLFFLVPWNQPLFFFDPGPPPSLYPIPQRKTLPKFSSWFSYPILNSCSSTMNHVNLLWFTYVVLDCCGDYCLFVPYLSTLSSTQKGRCP